MPSFDFPEIPMGDAFARKDKECVGTVPVFTTDNALLASPAQEVRTIKIIVLGDPIPKGRARARIVKPFIAPPFIQFYQDADTEAYEKLVAIQGKIAMNGRGVCLGALRVDVRVYLPIPKSWPQKKKMAASDVGLIDASVLPVGRPDADNFLKCACDALNGICWKDDAQIIRMMVEKRYSEQPRLEIDIFPA